jgi:hypothetical protein
MISLKSTATTGSLFGNYSVHEVVSESAKLHKAYTNGKREEDMEDNKASPWRRWSWMEQKPALRACLVFMKVPYTSHRRKFFYPIKWQHAWNIDTTRKENRPREILESFRHSLQFRTLQHNTRMKRHYKEVNENIPMDQPRWHSSPMYLSLFPSGRLDNLLTLAIKRCAKRP